jgi:hypothetical protein
MDVRGSSKVHEVTMMIGRLIYPDDEISVDYDGPLRGIHRLTGWEERAERPPALDITIYLVAGEPQPDIVPVEFEVDLLVYAEVPYLTTLRAAMNLRTALI